MGPRVSWPESVILEMDVADVEALLNRLLETRADDPWTDAIERIYAYLDLERAKAQRAAVQMSRR
jgi:hypothetical protein